MDLDEARRQATEIVNAARDGRDPGQERKQARIAAADVLTVGDLIGAYLREHAERHQRPRTLIETRRALERHWAPLHGLPAADVTRRDVSARLIELARSTGTVGANRARGEPVGGVRWAHEGRAGRPQPDDRHDQERGSLARAGAVARGAARDLAGDGRR